MAQRKKTTVGIAFGLVLKALREDRGLTQEQLADRIDYSRVQIGYIETGLRQPSLEAILKLEAALKVDSGDLTKLTATKLRQKAESR